MDIVHPGVQGEIKRTTLATLNGNTTHHTHKQPAACIPALRIPALTRDACKSWKVLVLPARLEAPFEAAGLLRLLGGFASEVVVGSMLGSL